MLVSTLLALAAPAQANADHDRARCAHEAGEIVGLDLLLARIKRDQPGKVVNVELERDGDRFVYEVKLITSEGRLRMVKYDARSLEFLER